MQDYISSKTFGSFCRISLRKDRIPNKNMFQNQYSTSYKKVAVDYLKFGVEIFKIVQWLDNRPIIILPTKEEVLL